MQEPTPDSDQYTVIDPKLLNSETLTNLAREFVLRERGQEAACHDGLESQTAAAVQKILNGRAIISFDRHAETVGVMTREAWEAYRQGF